LTQPNPSFGAELHELYMCEKYGKFLKTENNLGRIWKEEKLLIWHDVKK
jgi:hypothetical protein